MAVRLKPKDKKPAIIGDWRTGKYSQGALADKHGVSKGFVHNCVKGIEQDTAIIVDNIVQAKHTLALMDEQSVNAVNDAVHERTKHLAFFADLTIKNCSLMMKKITEKSEISDHSLAQRTLRDGRETVMGKEVPNQNVQVNTGVTVVISEIDASI